MLITLPTEVLQTILWNMDAGTLLISILVCKTFFSAANARTVLLYHLHRIPGYVVGIEDLPTAMLFIMFRRRATRDLYAAGALTDTTVYGAGGANVKIRECSFTAGPPALLAAVDSTAPIIDIYKLGSQKITLMVQLQSQLPEDHCYEILKIAFGPPALSDGFHIAALQRHKVFDMVGPVNDGHTTLKLLTFHHLYAHCSSTQNSTTVTQERGHEPVGLALARNGNICIAWRQFGVSTSVSLYAKDLSPIEDDSDTPPLLSLTYDDPPPLPGPAWALDRENRALIFKMQFTNNDKCLNFYQPGVPVHSWFTYCCKVDCRNRTLRSNARVLMAPLDTYEAYSCSMPFYASCYSEFDQTLNMYHCETTYLAIALAVNDRVKPNVFVVGGSVHWPATTICTHSRSLEEGIRNLTGWRAHGFLAGWRQGESSIGTVMATSPGGTRIAAATWTNVLVWSIEPDLFRPGEPYYYFRQQEYNARRKIGRLRPVKLPSRGVVHSMQWMNETVLYAMTDQGLVRWDLGGMSSGKERTYSLNPILDSL